MASLDEIEGGLTEGVTTIVVVAIVLFGFIAYMSWRNIAIPIGAYPYSVFSRFASWIDGVFYASPIAGGKTQQTTDHFLGGLGNWLVSNTPNPASSPNWADYSTQFDSTDDPATVSSLGGS